MQVQCMVHVSLYEYLFKSNIVTSNKCQGGETESVKHYALHSYFRSTKWQWSNDVLIRALKYTETGQ